MPKQALVRGHPNCCGCKTLLVPAQPPADWVASVRAWLKEPYHQVWHDQQLYFAVPRDVLDHYSKDLEALGFKRLCRSSANSEIWGKVL